MLYTVSDSVTATKLIGNELVNYAINAYGWLVPDGESMTLGQFADRIADFYHVDEGRNKEVYDILKEFSEVVLTPEPQFDPQTLGAK